MREYRVHMIKATQYNKYMSGYNTMFRYMDILVDAKNKKEAMNIADEINKGWIALKAEKE